jgi:hypothetical protein
MNKLLKPIISASFLVLFFQAGSSVHAQLIRVTSRVSSDSMMIGDQVLYTLRVEAADNVDFRLPVIRDTLSRDLEVISPVSADTAVAAGQRTVEHGYIITSFEAGMHVLPSQGVVYLFNGQTDTARSMPLMVSVYEPEVDTTKAIMPIKPPINTPVTFKEVLPWLGIGAGGLLLGTMIAALVWIYRQRRRDPEVFSYQPRDPAHVIAFRELDRLKEEKLWERGLVKQYYTRLTEITRAYIERQYGIPAMERTTGEILQAFRRSNLEDGLLEEILEELLQLADLVKFAKEEPLPVENQTNLNNVYLFVQKTFPMFYIQKPEPEEGVGTGENPGKDETLGTGQIRGTEVAAQPGKEGLKNG